MRQSASSIVNLSVHPPHYILTKGSVYQFFYFIIQIKRLQPLKFICKSLLGDENEKCISQEVGENLHRKETPKEKPLCVADNEALSQALLTECCADKIRLQKEELSAFAATQLIDLFLLEHAIRKLSLQGCRSAEKMYSSLALDNLIFDLLLRQFFTIQLQQRVTSENVPLGEFHQKAFMEVASNVILTELSKIADEDMEDLLEYERENKSPR